MKQKQKNKNNNAIVKRCQNCDVPEDQGQLVEIIVPPTLMSRIVVCVKCRDQIIDNATQKDKAKSESET